MRKTSLSKVNWKTMTYLNRMRLGDIVLVVLILTLSTAEPELYFRVNKEVDPVQLGRDYAKLRHLMNSIPPFDQRLLVGPALIASFHHDFVQKQVALKRLLKPNNDLWTSEDKSLFVAQETNNILIHFWGMYMILFGLFKRNLPARAPNKQWAYMSYNSASHYCSNHRLAAPAKWNVLDSLQIFVNRVILHWRLNSTPVSNTCFFSMKNQLSIWQFCHFSRPIYFLKKILAYIHTQ